VKSKYKYLEEAHKELLEAKKPLASEDFWEDGREKREPCYYPGREVTEEYTVIFQSPIISAIKAMPHLEALVW
jgi:hypothetical protein